MANNIHSYSFLSIKFSFRETLFFLSWFVAKKLIPIFILIPNFTRSKNVFIFC